MSFNPRALTERTLKGFVDRWVRAQRAKPCPTPDQWPPSRAACQEDIAQLLGFANWHEAITAIRQLQNQEQAASTVNPSDTSAEPGPFFDEPIHTTEDAAAFLNWAYSRWILGVALRAGCPIYCQGESLTSQPLNEHQLSLFRELCHPSSQLLFRPDNSSVRITGEISDPDSLYLKLSAHHPLVPPRLEPIPGELLGRLASPPQQGLVLMAGLSDLMPSIATFTAQRYARMKPGRRLFHTLSKVDSNLRIENESYCFHYDGTETLDLKIRMAMRRRPTTMVLGEPQTAEDIGQVITASMVGHLVYASHTKGRVVDAVVDWVERFPQEQQAGRIVDILSTLRLLVGGAWERATDGSPRWNYEYLIMNDGLVDEILDNIKIDQGSNHPKPSLTILRTTLESATKEHGHTFMLKTSAIRRTFPRPRGLKVYRNSVWFSKDTP